MGVSFDCELDDSGDVNSKFKGMKIDNLRFKDEDEVEFLFFFLKESRVFVWIFFFYRLNVLILFCNIFWNLLCWSFSKIAMKFCNFLDFV
jgi:hypothetical protein